MWAFLFVLAIIPLFFFFTDDLGKLFPQWQQYLPQSAKAGLAAEPGEPTKLVASTLGVPGVWVQVEDAKGFAAWVFSDDMEYRLAVGCRAGAAPAMQVTHTNGAAMTNVTLNYKYGYSSLPLGYLSNSYLVDTTAQLTSVRLQNEIGQVLAQFSATSAASGLIARALAENCKVKPPTND